MLWDFCPSEYVLALLALHLNYLTVILPVHHQSIAVFKWTTIVTAWYLAFENDSTRFPVLFSILVLEHDLTLITFEFKSIKLLLHESIERFRWLPSCATVRACLILSQPICDASIAHNLVACAALEWIFNDAQANLTGEVAIHRLHGASLRLDLTGALRLAGNFVLELFECFFFDKEFVRGTLDHSRLIQDYQEFKFISNPP